MIEPRRRIVIALLNNPLQFVIFWILALGWRREELLMDVQVGNCLESSLVGALEILGRITALAFVWSDSLQSILPVGLAPRGQNLLVGINAISRPPRLP